MAQSLDPPAASPSPQPILDLLNGFRASKVLFTLVKLGVPDAIAAQQQQQQQQQQQLVSLEDLAKLIAAPAAPVSAAPADAAAAASGDPAAAGSAPAPAPTPTAAAAAASAEPSHDGLGRLLDAAVGLGLLSGDRRGYGLTPMTRMYLLSGSEDSLSGYVQHSDMLYTLWGHLHTSVTTGSNAWGAAFGLSSSEIFSSLYDDDASVLRFMRGMHGFSQLSAQAVLTAFDLSGFRVLVDWGGATGALAAAACVIYSGLSKAVVVDLPHVVEKAREHFSKTPTAVAAGSRLSWVPADFFGPTADLPDGELVVLGRILHDWEEERVMQLLHKAYDKLPQGGALLIAEMLLDEGGTSPPEVLLQSLNMLTQTHGRERSLSQYKALLESVGFTNIQGKKTGTYLDAVIAYKM